MISLSIVPPRRLKEEHSLSPVCQWRAFPVALSFASLSVSVLWLAFQIGGQTEDVYVYEQINR